MRSHVEVRKGLKTKCVLALLALEVRTLRDRVCERLWSNQSGLAINLDSMLLLDFIGSLGGNVAPNCCEGNSSIDGPKISNCPLSAINTQFVHGLPTSGANNCVRWERTVEVAMILTVDFPAQEFRNL